jgi:hypothetical protein
MTRYAPFVPTAPTVPEYGLFSTYLPGDDVTVWRADQCRPRRACVLAVGDGRLMVQYKFGATRWVCRFDLVDADSEAGNG